MHIIRIFIQRVLVLNNPMYLLTNILTIKYESVLLHITNWFIIDIKIVT